MSELMYVVRVNKKKRLVLPESDAFEYASHGYKIKPFNKSPGRIL